MILSYFYSKRIIMKLFKSPFFYLPIIGILAINRSMEDIGLWERIAVGSVAGIAAMAIAMRKFQTRFSLIEFLALGLVLWPFIGFSHATAVSELYGHISRMSLIFAMIMISAEYFRNFEKNTLHAYAIGSQVALILTALSEFPSLIEAYQEDNIYLASGVFFAHKNYAAATLLLMTPAALLSKIDSKPGLWLQRIAIALAFIQIILLRTRGVWLAAALMIIVAIIYYSVNTNNKFRNQSLIALAVLLVGIGAETMINGTEKVLNSSTIESRMHYWDASVDMFLDNPISGVGGGQWKIKYPATGLRGTNESVMNGTTSILRPHNDFLWLLSETGIGVVFFIGLAIIAVANIFRQKSQVILGLTTVAFLGYGLGEFPLERATLFIPFAIALGYQSSKSKIIYANSKAAGVTIVVGLVLLFSLTNSGFRIRGEKNAELALEGYLGKDYGQMLEYSRKEHGNLFEIDVFNNPLAYFEGLGVLISGGQSPSPEILEESAEIFEHALEVHPHHMLSLNQLGQIRRLQGNLDAAKELYGHVLEMSPRNTMAAVKLAEVERMRGDIYASMNALKMLDKKYNPSNLNGLGREAARTLQTFAGIENPRPAAAKLHSALQGKSESEMWAVWSSFRK